jgi:protein-S-isoprenylcysteine O-methyltransferase Ste14
MWKHIRAILLLPGVVTVVVPATILFLTGTDTFGLSSHAPVARMVIGILGIVCIGIEVVLFGATVYLLATSGRGTLAPWNPTRNLVVEGAYCHVRNPMISSVFAILLGEALAAASVPLFLCPRSSGPSLIPCLFRVVVQNRQLNAKIEAFAGST